MTVKTYIEDSQQNIIIDDISSEEELNSFTLPKLKDPPKQLKLSKLSLPPVDKR